MRKYISLLPIILENAKAIVKEDINAMRYDSDTQGRSSVTPMFEITDGEETQSYTTQTTYGDTLSTYPVEFCDGGTFDFPYIAEIEYLRQSHFEFVEEELLAMQQMFMLQIKLWCKIKRVNVSDFIIHYANDIKDCNIDENMDEVLAMVDDAYKAFTPFSPATNMLTSRHVGKWYVVPTSSICAWSLARDLWGSGYSHGIYIDSKLLTFMPYVAIYSLLEAKSKLIEHFTHEDYNAYLSKIEIVRDHLITVPYEGDVPASTLFSYGAVPRRTNHYFDLHDNDDLQFIRKVTSKSLVNLQNSIVSKNAVIVDQSRIVSYNRDLWGTQINVHLNTKYLDWEGNNNGE